MHRLAARREPGTAQQQHREETAGEHVEGKAETGPPHGNAGIHEEQVMKEVEDPVPGEGNHNQPKFPLKPATANAAKTQTAIASPTPIRYSIDSRA